MDFVIVNNTHRERFELVIDGEVGAFTDYLDVADRRLFDHTVTESRFQGRGLASALIDYALTCTRDEGRSITAPCTFVSRFIDEHPEYKDLVA